VARRKVLALGWVMGGLCFLWALFTIGDKKNEWENPY
jgi:hypothetical protein